MNLQILINIFQNDPGKFIPQDSIYQLMAFLRGYCFAQNVVAIDSTGKPCQDHELLESFADYIRSQYSYDGERISIEEVLYEVSPESAFELFFEHWDGFIGVAH
ncbi:hypothetical protein C1E23_20945 [Pseudoalteromonas phenolica]|uniref:Uncharacterized protein n=1 Tax=Pseudoalteromonas phenolica TaxID=161398 RepID=A0A4Q7IIH7_9GAMM|nr:hypothetical protein C1E23_20945 [Pseudoalteromonas phenolica]